jgi:hypothetical protein
MVRFMGDSLKLIWCMVNGFFRSRASLKAEILMLRHQLNVLRRKAPKRLVFSNFDRFVFASLYRIAPGVLNALVIVKPETVIRWHRAGFRLFWRWNSHSRVGRPKVPLEIRQLIHAQMSLSDSFAYRETVAWAKTADGARRREIYDSLGRTAEGPDCLSPISLP